MPADHSTIRVLIIDDSSLVRDILSAGLARDPAIQVVGAAKDAYEASQMITSLRPDVLTLDVEMPRMNGIDFLRKLMPQYPLPVIMVSALTERGGRLALDALALGAVDFVTKPKGDQSEGLSSMLGELIAKIKMAVTANLPYLWSMAKKNYGLAEISRDPAVPPIQGAAGETGSAESAGSAGSAGSAKSTSSSSRRVAAISAPSRAAPAHSAPNPPRQGQAASASGRLRPALRHLVAIGASTGGNEAIKTILAALPANSPGVVVVQHMPKGYTRFLAERLDNVCLLRVKEAKDGDSVMDGTALLAPGGHQMRLHRKGAADNWFVSVRPESPVEGHAPSVGVLFRSLAEQAGLKIVAVMLTGMGSDGAEAMKLLREGGACCLAQDQASSVVFGMPAEAYRLGGAEKLVPLPEMASEIVAALKRQGYHFG